jgi:hypothetical protein
MVTAPYFLATKIEAFYGRGKKDFLASHDMEDIINKLFIESLSGHLLPDKASQARLPFLLERIRKIADVAQIK